MRPQGATLATCVECSLTGEVDEFTICSECAEPAHANGICTADCPFCGDLICGSCIDSAPQGMWHACGSKDPDDVAGPRRPQWV